MKTSQTSLSALLALVVSLQLTPVRSLTLFVTYPDSANPSTVRLSCMDGANRSENAMFQRNGVDIAAQVTMLISFPGAIEFTMSQELEGSFTCTADGDISNTVSLPVKSLTSGSSDHSMQMAGMIAGSTAASLTVLITSTVLTTLIVMWRRYLARKQRAPSAEEEVHSKRSEEEAHESSRERKEREVVLDMEDETPDKMCTTFETEYNQTLNVCVSVVPSHREEGSGKDTP